MFRPNIGLHDSSGTVPLPFWQFECNSLKLSWVWECLVIKSVHVELIKKHTCIVNINVNIVMDHYYQFYSTRNIPYYLTTDIDILQAGPICTTEPNVKKIKLQSLKMLKLINLRWIMLRIIQKISHHYHQAFMCLNVFIVFSSLHFDQIIINITLRSFSK